MQKYSVVNVSIYDSSLKYSLMLVVFYCNIKLAINKRVGTLTWVVTFQMEFVCYWGIAMIKTIVNTNGN